MNATIELKSIHQIRQQISALKRGHANADKDAVADILQAMADHIGALEAAQQHTDFTAQKGTP